MISIFPLLYYNVIPSRPTASALTPIGLAVYFAVAFSVLGVGIAHQTRGGRRFKQEWSEKHPLAQRTYGNLRGIEVQLKEIHGKLRTALASGIEIVVSPVSAVALHLTNAVVGRKAGKAKLDKYEHGSLWFYNGFNMLVSMELNEESPIMLDEERIRIALKKGQIELSIENSADLQFVLSVLNASQIHRTDPMVSQ